MRTHNIIRLFLALVSLNITTELSAQELVLSDTITVRLERKIGTGPFFQATTLIQTASTDPEDRHYGYTEIYKDIPKGLEDYTFSLGVWNSDPRQSVWSRLKAGMIDSASVYDQWFGGLSEEQLSRFTDEFVDTQVSVLYAEKSDEHIFIVDQDNDESFLDEKIHYLTPPPDSIMPLLVESPTYSALIERNLNKQVVQDSAYITFNPFRGMISIGASEHRFTTINIDGELKHIYVNNKMHGIRYDEDYFRMIVSDEPFTEENALPFMGEKSKSQLRFGDRFQTEFANYRVVGISEDGLDLKLLRESKDVAWYGTQIGATAPMIEGQTISGEAFRSEKGKFRILDFWATWCAPCLGEVPYLLDANEFFEGFDFEVVSIADDKKEQVEPFVKRREMDWAHLIAKESGEVLKDYGVTGYPTYYLLDDENKVLMRDYALRGSGLVYEVQKAMQVSDEHMAKQIRKGNLLIRIANNNYTKVQVSSKFTPNGAKPLYNRHNSEGNWERGFNLEPGVYSTHILYYISGEPAARYADLDIEVTGEAGQVIELNLAELN